MNISTAYPLGVAPGISAINSLASLPGMPCRCRLGMQASQALISTRITSALRHLDELDAVLASNRLSGWTGAAAEGYRNYLDGIARQSALLRHDIHATSRLLWSAGAA